MSEITVTQIVDANPEQVWNILADFGAVSRFHPRVDRSPLIGDQTQGLGAQRTCHFHDGNSVVEKIVGWTPKESLVIEIVEGSMPLKSARATISMKPHGRDKTEVSFEMAYIPKWGPVGKVMDVMMMRSQFRKILGEVLDGLEIHAKTGKIVGPDMQPTEAAA